MRITVFTPTYNRAYILHNLYESLKRQAFVEFEWLIIDDGSSDNTENLVKQWIEEKNKFSIRYYRQENTGKCQAINKALELAFGELFFTVDSDDYLTDDALEKIDQWEKMLPQDKKYCGVAGNLGFSKNETINPLFEGCSLDKNLLARYSYEENGQKVLGGERAFVFYTDVHRKYLYPKFSGEKFMTEAVAWNRMAADGYFMRFYNDIIWIFEYKDDGLTKAGNKLFLNNPHGYGLWLREKAKFENETLKEKLRMYYTFTCDLSALYNSDIIAECIGAPVGLVCLFRVMHKIIEKLRKRD